MTEQSKVQPGLDLRKDPLLDDGSLDAALKEAGIPKGDEPTVIELSQDGAQQQAQERAASEVKELVKGVQKAPKKRSWPWKRKEKPEAESVGTKSGRAENVPVRLLIGYLPNSTERDARDYAQGVAEKHFDQPAIAHYDAFRYLDGFAYEVHEGGTGQAFLPAIIERFKSLGPFVQGEPERAIIRTGQRMVQVQRTATGLSAILLPESSSAEPSDWVVANGKLSPAMNQHTGFFSVSAVMFVTGFFALIVAALMTRHQPYEEPLKPQTVRVAYDQLPISRWPMLLNLGPGQYVSEISYSNGRWNNPTVKSAAIAPAPVTPVAEESAGTPAPEAANPASSAKE